MLAPSSERLHAAELSDLRSDHDRRTSALVLRLLPRGWWSVRQLGHEDPPAPGPPAFVVLACVPGFRVHFLHDGPRLGLCPAHRIGTAFADPTRSRVSRTHSSSFAPSSTESEAPGVKYTSAATGLHSIERTTQPQQQSLRRRRPAWPRIFAAGGSADSAAPLAEHAGRDDRSWSRRSSSTSLPRAARAASRHRRRSRQQRTAPRPQRLGVGQEKNLLGASTFDQQT